MERDCDDRTKDNGLKLGQARLKLDIRKKLFTMAVVRHWNRCAREFANVSSLEVFKTRLDEDLSNLV